MKKMVVQTLLVNDSDLRCNCDSITLDSMELTDLNFLLADIERFELIIYEGERGTKILKSRYTASGKIVD